MSDFTLRDAAPALALGLAAIVYIAALTFSSAGTTRAEVFSPQLSLGEIITNVNKAGGQVIATGHYGNIVYARYPAASSPAPTGAWLSASVEALAACSPTLRTSQTR